jgi:hypothetical protein
MAKPRVFVSSTYYDLKYVRASLELFINSLGFDSVLFEHGDVAFMPDKALDESCYREVQGCDMYVLIVGGRYGSETSATKTEKQREFYEQYESVTKTEYKSALDKDMPIYILIDKNVYAEYQTYRKNPANATIIYAHVDHSGVFKLIEEILSRKRNNPMQTFDRYSEIEEWLRSQWAGLYRELLTRMSSQGPIVSLSQRVNELGAVTQTLQRYLEDMMRHITPDKATTIIQEEHERLAEAESLRLVQRNPLVNFLMSSRWEDRSGIDQSKLYEVVSMLRHSQGLDEFVSRLGRSHSFDADTTAIIQSMANEPVSKERLLGDFEAAKSLLSSSPLSGQESTAMGPQVETADPQIESVRSPGKTKPKK